MQNQDHFYMLPHPALEKFINYCNQRGLKKILDMGCGTGRHLTKLAEQGFTISGIDISPSAAALAEKWLHQKGYEGDIIVGDFDDKVKDFEDGSFDGIIAVNSLENGPKGELENNLMQISKLLKPQGLFLLVYMSKESKPEHKEENPRFLSEEDLKALVLANLKILESSQDQDKNFVIFAEKL